MPLHPLLASIFTHLGHDSTTLSGPVIRTPAGTYYAKTARGRSASQLRGEAASLAAMLLTAPAGLVPRVLGYVDPSSEESGAETGALATDYADGRGGGGGGQAALGRALALMHRPPPSSSPSKGDGRSEEGKAKGIVDPRLAEHATYTGLFGFAVPTHCGATEQDNTWTEGWEEFFRDRRLGDLVSRIGDARVERAWERCLER